MLQSSLTILSTALTLVLASSVVHLDNAIVTGAASGNVSQFLGIPYAEPPTGNRRFRLPQPISAYSGLIDATALGPSCTQMTGGTFNVEGLPLETLEQFSKFGSITAESEDCLSINVIAPAGLSPEVRLPVLVCIYGGGFAVGGSEIWGESAGAWSVAMHMVAHDGDTEGLCRAGVMQSGAVLPLGDMESGQTHYDDIVGRTGCSYHEDSLQCLREVTYDDLKVAVNALAELTHFQSLDLVFSPHGNDGVLFSDSFNNLVRAGKIAPVPIITGNCADEGTLFSLSQRNITTEVDMRDYMQTFLFPNISETDLNELIALYPNIPSAGSPYATGDENVLYPQFKRIASLQGDVTFEVPRRVFLKHLSEKQARYSFISKRLKAVPYLGAFHSTDLADGSYAPDGELMGYTIRFTANLNPNHDGVFEWPQWTPESPRMLSFDDGDMPLSLTEDTYRQQGMEKIAEVFFQRAL